MDNKQNMNTQTLTFSRTDSAKFKGFYFAFFDISFVYLNAIIPSYYEKQLLPIPYFIP